MSGKLLWGPTRAEAPLVQRVLEYVRSPEFRPPDLPRLTAEIMALGSDPDSAQSGLIDLLLRDEALAAHLMQVAGSEAQATNRVAVRRAVEALGARAARRVALVYDIEGSVFRTRHYDLLMLRYWRHSVATAVALDALSKSLGARLPGAFTTGLLHDVGRPVALTAIAGLRTQVRALGAATDAAIARIVDEVHEQVGGMVAVRWGLSRPLVQLLGGHHELSLLDRDVRQVGALLAGAEALAEAVGCASTGVAHAVSIDIGAVRALGVDSATTARLLEKVTSRTKRLLGTV